MTDEEIVIVTSKLKPVKKQDGVRIVDVESEEGRRLAAHCSPEDLPKVFSLTNKPCTITKQDDGVFVAVCDSRKVRLETDEECPGCAEAIAVGWALNYISPHDKDLAETLFKQVTTEEISPDEAMDKCVVVADESGDKNLVDTIKQLKEMMHKPLSELTKEAET